MSKSDIAVAVRGLGKSYTIAHDQERHVTLAEAMLARLKNPLKRGTSETFWALKDVSFDIKKGDVVGIIGRNGAGKSTLLKILSRITEPTQGEIEIRGRIGSLLEVGTGFHPELTGRENIFLNGQILGMRKAEIRKQFDAIVDFSGCEQFLDTPVKRYSSGMYVRLAFAVAAHLNSEILIVDEVLAVGDTEFQKKCMGKMHDVASSGRTVLFVSHNMSAVENLCNRGTLLHKGFVLKNGPVDAIIQAYQSSVMGEILGSELSSCADRTGNGLIRLTNVRIEDRQNNPLVTCRSGQDIQVVLGYEADESYVGETVDVGISVGYGDSALLFVLYSSYLKQQFRDLPPRGEFRCSIDCFPLSAGTYVLGARILVDGDEADWPRDGVREIIVEGGDFFGSGSSGFGASAPLLVPGNWSLAGEAMLKR